VSELLPIADGPELRGQARMLGARHKRALLGVVSGRGVKLSPGMMGVSKKSLDEGRSATKAGKTGAGAR
jgi:hypothetical protein